MKAVKIRLTMLVGRKRKKSRWWRERIRRRGPRNAARWGQGTTDQLSKSRRRSHQGSEMMFNFRSHRWSKELLLSSSRVWNALHVSSAIRALSFAPNSIGMGTVALDRGMLLR